MLGLQVCTTMPDFFIPFMTKSLHFMHSFVDGYLSTSSMSKSILTLIELIGRCVGRSD
jgi:hypothetical protein